MKNTFKIFAAVVLWAGVLCSQGCALFRGPEPQPNNFENILTLSSSKDSLRNAIVMAATRRRWIPSDIDADTIRCTLIQRAHKVEIDVKIIDDKTYSILYVSSNIPNKKYYQWVNNLQRSIQKMLR